MSHRSKGGTPRQRSVLAGLNSREITLDFCIVILKACSIHAARNPSTSARGGTSDSTLVPPPQNHYGVGVFLSIVHDQTAEHFDSLTERTFTWNTNLPANTNLFFFVTDSTSNSAQSNQIHVQPSSENTCLQQ
ncbi:uncharacterized protein TRAVEDRAFT_54093 [Trametes versicolor FP-101664 SS1]|uniref:Uncharacterized protein n=1 Tax=Trametes versicolor (strain FP-101664) TaxID=717944 RepID=R7S8V9_TRAVS|nr:uncharacterized protein TRAVEDRAFT_54093 [Trametes versicolor FP-101664 SS1]EIW52120.1 hypothetical protein TRAVEDRAFT_54093 [Trametes versicolor FP-101664 SS1]